MSKKAVYRPSDWSHYNKQLIGRGSLTLWVHETVIDGWYEHAKTGRRGASKTYSDLAIVCAAQLRFLYKLPLRATQGFLGSLFKLLNIPHQPPCYTTLCRRFASMEITLPVTPRQAPRHLALDSTGLKVYGEGEWKVRLQGRQKRRTWRKIHLGIDLQTQEIVCSTVTTNDFRDSEMFEACLAQLPVGEVASIVVDGAYDTQNCYQYCHTHHILPIIPPRQGAHIQVQALLTNYRDR